uniref:Reverse transcriptase RNase H-like domain-containing protein n=1 Tax=Romanomermis culicivorax TaxID=13658 RepID=A0A915KU89_ROMCU
MFCVIHPNGKDCYASDTIKVVTWGTDTIEVLQLVIDGATRQINFVQPIAWTPPATAVQSVQSTPVASHRYLSDIACHFPKLTADGMGKFPDFEHGITLTDDAIPVTRPVRQVPIARCAEVEKEVEQMVTNDIWERFMLITDHQALVSILAQSGSGRKAHKFDQWRARLGYSIQAWVRQRHPGHAFTVVTTTTYKSQFNHC